MSTDILNKSIFEKIGGIKGTESTRDQILNKTERKIENNLSLK